MANKKISELTAVDSVSATATVPIVQGGVTVTATVTDLVQANDELGAMAPAVQTLIDAASVEDRIRTNHTGQDQAANVDVAFNGKTVEACLVEIYAALAGAGPSAPTIATAPTIDDTTPIVGQLLTATATSDPANTTKSWQWNANGIQISGASAATFTVQAAQLGKYLTVTQRSTNDTNGLYSESTSLATSVVTGTQPTNSVAPSISPSGSQTVGQTHTVNTGTWSGASTYGIQFYYNSVPTGVRSATTTIIPDATKAGATLTFDVIAYSSLGVASDVVAGSNSVTLTGTTAVVNTVAPAWPATIYFGTAADFTEGTWTGTINAARTWQFFRNAETTPYVSPPNTISIHTPRTPAVVGDTLYIEETVTETATGNTYTVRSVGKTISATPATLAAALTSAGAAGYSLTQGAPMTASNFGVIAGGTSPYGVSMSPSLPSGLTATVIGSNLVLSGTPASTTASTSYVATVTDSVGGTPVTITIVIVINPQSVSSLPAKTVVNVESYNQDTGWSGQTITGSDGIVRTQPFSNVLGTGKPGYLRRVKSGDPLLFSAHRSEFSWYGTDNLQLGIDYWFSFAFRPISGEWPGSTGNYSDQQIIFQIHQFTDSDGPIFAMKRNGGNGSIVFEQNYDVGSDHSNSNDMATLGAGSLSLMPVDTWSRVIIHLRFGNSTSYAPRCEAWINGTKHVDLSGTQCYMGGPLDQYEYAKIGFYFWNETNYGATTTRAAYYSDLYFGQGANLYSEAVAAVAAFT